MTRTSKISGFYKLSIPERTKILKEFSNLSDEDIKILQSEGIKLEQAGKMIENVIGVIKIPLGIALNFTINGKDYLIPMATEEPSVVAAASNAAKIAGESGGFKTSSTEPIMIGQIQILTKDPEKAERIILENKNEILRIANSQDSTLIKLGGGAKDIDVRIISTNSGKMVILHLLVDVRDAMGANAVNTMAESVAPFIEEITNCKVLLRIISNLATERLARAEVIIKKDLIGADAVEGIINAYDFALSDPYRAVTHNKGIMNGITAVVLATGNDTRAIEAGAHGYAAIGGKYKPLTMWEKNRDGDLVGRIEIPVAVGIVGGATMNPVARTSLKIIGVKTAKELSEILAAVGLAQNFAALKALSTEGIQRGHMELHARNVAVMAGAEDKEIDRVAEILVNEKKIRLERAKELVEIHRNNKNK